MPYGAADATNILFLISFELLLSFLSLVLVRSGFAQVIPAHGRGVDTIRRA
jgi:hypothetical protein